MIILPQSYTIIASNQIEKEIRHLTETLSQTNYEDAGGIIKQFCQNNQALVILSGNDTYFSFGYVDEQSVIDDNAMTNSIDIQFADRNETYYLSITEHISVGHELNIAFLKLLPYLLMIIFAISTIGAFLCSKILVKPVLEISRISKRMANLDMTWDCYVNRTDELGVLANSLNVMAKRLDEAIKELENANQKLLEDMKHITEISRQRRDFFAAASHELKTPITILKGQIESMILGIGSYKDTKKVLPDTLKEVENMEHLVKEILTISKIEMNGLTDRTETVSLSITLNNVIKSLIPLIEKHRITVHSEITEKVIVLGNASLLEKAIHNIMNNAIRHSPESAEVFIQLTTSTLTITNTGTSIPQEDLPLLFTPFYRVEKSRNKSTGGSGLGLYLVKTIMELHKFRYHIKNTKMGVVFKIEF